MLRRGVVPHHEYPIDNSTENGIGSFADDLSDCEDIGRINPARGFWNSERSFYGFPDGMFDAPRMNVAENMADNSQ